MADVEERHQWEGPHSQSLGYGEQGMRVIQRDMCIADSTTVPMRPSLAHVRLRPEGSLSAKQGCGARGQLAHRD